MKSDVSLSRLFLPLETAHVFLKEALINESNSFIFSSLENCGKRLSQKKLRGKLRQAKKEHKVS